MMQAMLGAETAVRLGEGLDDDALVERLRAGDRRFFEVLIRRHNARLFRVARAVLRDDMLAEEAMQEAYVSAYLHLDQFEGRASFGSWLARIAVRAALHQRRAAQGRPASDAESPASPLDDPEMAAQRREARALLTRTVDALPETLRLVFVMREVEGVSVADTAEALDLSEENVKVRLHRARMTLRQSLSDAFDGAVADLFPFHLVRCDRVVLGSLSRLPPPSRSEGGWGGERAAPPSSSTSAAPSSLPG